MLCTHGDVIGDLLMHLADCGLRLDDVRLEKGSVWVLECETAASSARYVTPPVG